MCIRDRSERQRDRRAKRKGIRKDKVGGSDGNRRLLGYRIQLSTTGDSRRFHRPAANDFERRTDPISERRRPAFSGHLLRRTHRLKATYTKIRTGPIAEMSDAWLVPENAFLPVAIS